MLLSTGAMYGTAAPPATDPFFANVVLLCGFNDTDGSQIFIDESPAAHTLGFNGATHIDTAQSVFGGSSLLLDGNFDWVDASDSADWHFGSGDFTIEGWFRFASNTTTMGLVTQWNTTGNQRGWMFLYRGADATDTVGFSRSTNGSGSEPLFATSAWTPTLNTWYALCVERSGSTWRIYIDGVMLGTQTESITLFNSTSQLYIGGTLSSGGDKLEFNGWIDEVRITKGVARYASDGGYTVATSQFPRS